MASIALAALYAMLALFSGGPSTLRAQSSATPSPLESLPPLPAPGAFTPPAERPPDPTEFRRRNPFGLRLSHEDGKPKVAPPSAPPPAPAMVSTVDPSSKLELLGTYVADNGRYAIIRDKSTNREDVHKVGSSPLANSRITSIEAREVRMTIDGVEAPPLVIDYKGWKLAAVPSIPQPASDTNGYIPPADPGVPAAVSPDTPPRRLARQEVDTYLDNLNTLLTQVNIQPVFQGGQPAGFRLSDIQKGTILDQIGLQDGDTLRFVNGQRIDSVQSAFQLYNVLKESTNVEITVLRNTRPTTLRYAIY